MLAHFKLQPGKPEALLAALGVDFPGTATCPPSEVDDTCLLTWKLKDDIYLSIITRGEANIVLRTEMDHGFYEARMEVEFPDMVMQYLVVAENFDDNRSYERPISIGELGHPHTFMMVLKELLQSIPQEAAA